MGPPQKSKQSSQQPRRRRLTEATTVVRTSAAHRSMELDIRVNIGTLTEKVTNSVLSERRKTEVLKQHDAFSDGTTPRNKDVNEAQTASGPTDTVSTCRQLKETIHLPVELYANHTATSQAVIVGRCLQASIECTHRH